MPELPDVTVYVEALERFVVGHRLRRVRVVSPFFVRTVEPPLKSAEGRRVTSARRLGKRVVVEMEGDLFLVIHLMIAGRLQWRKPQAKFPLRTTNAVFDFDHGSLHVTEAGSRKRASLHVVQGAKALAAHDPGGVEPLDVDAKEFAAALTRENHTVKRALTDPRILSGIGNAYSDEILHRARLSPFALTQSMTSKDLARLQEATVAVLTEWTDRLRSQTGDKFPAKVTAFRAEMAVHGRYGKPCPACSTPVQRIAYAKYEANYCPTCQTAGKLLKDRALSRLLKDDWPRSLEEMDARLQDQGA